MTRLATDDPARDPEKDYPFSFPEINIWLDEAEYILASDMIGEAAILTGGPETNPEYDRGQAELICRVMGWPGDHVSEVITCVHNISAEANAVPSASP